MRRMILTVALAAMLVSGCRSRTQYGDCIGVADDPDPKLVYRMSTRNVVLACLFVETIFVPVLVVAQSFKCPVGRK
jgi:hypothetical protein